MAVVNETEFQIGTKLQPLLPRYMDLGFRRPVWTVVEVQQTPHTSGELGLSFTIMTMDLEGRPVRISRGVKALRSRFGIV